MGQRETAIMRRSWLHASARWGARLFRNNVMLAVPHTTVKAALSALLAGRPHEAIRVLRQARMVRCGLAVGSSDLIGITPVVVTAAMVGRTIGVFTALESKQPGASLEPEQRTFIEAVKRMGGIAAKVTGPQDVDAAIEEAQKRWSD